MIKAIESEGIQRTVFKVFRTKLIANIFSAVRMHCKLGWQTSQIEFKVDRKLMILLQMYTN